MWLRVAVGANVGAWLKVIEEALDFGFLVSLDGLNDAAALTLMGSLQGACEEIVAQGEDWATGIGESFWHVEDASW